MRTMKVIVDAEDCEWEDVFDEDYVSMKLVDETNGDYEIMCGDTKHDDIYNKIRTFLQGIAYAEGNVTVDYYDGDIYKESELI
ncbi:MAG: hypothetical protein SPK43_01410 [Candidatus Onthovivens sp.]|nr:hypothetical protein [Candidatus Onthovivens sp.]